MAAKAGRSSSCGEATRSTSWISLGEAEPPTRLTSTVPTAPLNLETTQRQFAAPERYNRWPQAHLHTQWPGKGVPGDPVFDQFYASQMPSIQNFTLQQELNRDAIVALLEKIGPSILLTHSQSGAFGWPVADARPDLVKAILAVEPNGPPFFNVENVPAPEWFRDVAPQTRPWGVTAVPLAYSPAAAKASDLAIVQQDKPDGPDLVRCWMQKTPARQLPNLQKLPILILTAEASYHAPYDHCTVKYLEQAGVHPAWIKLADVGIHGNGHMMMLEKNNLDIAAVMSKWLDKAFCRDARRKSRVREHNSESRERRMTGVDRRTVDLSAYPDLVVIYLGMRVRYPHRDQDRPRVRPPDRAIGRSQAGRLAAPRKPHVFAFSTSCRHAAILARL